MRPLLHSLRFRLISFLSALLALWLVLALVGSILDARQRIAAEVKASSALARALISAVSSNTKDPAATLREVEKHMPRTRHVQLGISHSRDPAVIMSEALPQEQRRPAPSWFVNLGRSTAGDRTREYAVRERAGGSDLHHTQSFG